jgi:hypothetical protein
VDSIYAEQVSFHGKAEDLFVAEFIDQDRFQKARMDDVQSVERLADGVDALSGFELYVLEQELFIRIGGCGGYAQYFAQFLQV